MIQTYACQPARYQPPSDVASRHAIETERIDLQVIKSEDAVEFERLLGDPEVMQFVGLRAGEVLSKDQVSELVESAAGAWQKRGYGRWTLRDKETGRVIGFCGFRCEDGIPELICVLDKPYWSQGIALEASRACIDYGFNVLGFTKVQAFCRPEHTRARRVLEKLGAEYIANVDFHGVEGAAFVIEP
jgi:[ribosomal protein S5]-alanine N-acetyltransferase